MNKEFEKIIEKLKEEKMSYFLTIANTGDEKLDYAYEKVGNALDKAIDIVKQEAEQYNNGWIPVSEKLPEIDGHTSDIVLVCGSNGFQYMAFWCDDLKWRFCECGMAKNPVLWTEIIAWQPLPQPYQPKGE